MRPREASLRQSKAVRLKSRGKLLGPTRTRFCQLDGRLAEKLSGVVNRSQEPSLREDMYLKKEQMLNEGPALGGRQIAWMILDFFKTDRSLAVQSMWEDIKTITLKDDKHLESFARKWKHFIAHLMEPMPTETVLRAFLTKD